MCGIVGIVHRDPAHPVPPATIQRMCRAIAHRGPDDEGTFVSGRVGLGMRRLAIIDLAGGRQPIFNEDGSAAIVFNGEVYNYRALRQALLGRGHVFRTHSDTETVLHLYEEQGPACVDLLRGMFAFAIWDARQHTLLLARDRFGIKPLYYIAAPWGLAFASELKALLAAGLSERRLDWEGLDSYLELGYLPAPATPFTDVRKLEPGHVLVWHPEAEPAIHRYWDLPRESRPAPSELPQKILHWLDDSVAAHLVSDVPVAAFLSGGLDSGAVASSMAMQGSTPHAFTAHYRGSGAAEADERPLAAALARRYGARLTTVEIAPQLESILEPIVWTLDEPHADDSAVPTWALSQAVGAEYKVALTGIGGDELFAGYRRHLGMLWTEWYGRLPPELRRAAAWAVAYLREPAGAGLGINRLKRFARSGDGSAPERFLALVSRLQGAERARLYTPGLGAMISGTAARRSFEAHYAQGGAPAGLSAALYFDYKTFLPDDILALSDRVAMAHGLEIRVPFVDHVLVEAIHPLPAHAKLGWGRSKSLLRQALRSRLPAAHFRAPKRGFVGPTASWLRHELRPMLLDELSASRLSRLGYFDVPTVQRLLDDHFQRRHNREGILWALLCFSIWHRLYCEGAGPAQAGELTPAAPYAAASRR